MHVASEAGVTVMWAALLESCGIVTQREPVLVVLVHIKLRVLDARNRPGSHRLLHLHGLLNSES